LILNRADTRVGITRDDVLSVLGRSPDISIPSDREIPVAFNEGVPIDLANERSEAAKAFRSLASMYLEPVAAPALVPKSERAGVFSRRGRR